MPKLTRSPAQGAVERAQKRRDRDTEELVREVRILLRQWRRLIPLALSAYLLLRIVTLARADRSVTLEIVRRQGISGLTDAVVSSLLTEIGGVLLLSSLAVLFWVCSDQAFKDRVTNRRLGLRILIGLVALLVATIGASIPWTMAASITVLFLLGVVRLVGLPFAVLGAAVAILLVGPIFAAPWMPRERVLLQSSNPTSAYILGDGQGFVSFLTADDRKVLLVKADEVEGRTICRPNRNWWSFDSPSLLEIVWGSTPKCKDVKFSSTNGEDTPSAFVMCVDIDEGTVSRVVAVKEDCETGTRSVIVGERGPKGETGERGPIGPRGLPGDSGEQGAKGDPGEQGERGMTGEGGPPGDRHAWALVGADGNVVLASQSARSVPHPDNPTMYVVRFEGVDVGRCAVTAQSTSEAASGSTALLNVIVPGPKSQQATVADPGAGEVAIEWTSLGKGGANGFLVLLTCNQ